MFRRDRLQSSALMEAAWAPLGDRRLPGVSPSAHAWLRDPGSLTRSVMARCTGRFRVEVLAQGRAAALPSETLLLAAGPATATLVREVKLHCSGSVWVFARTLLPLPSLRGPLHALTQLGQRPLGEVLFSDPTTRRLRVEVSRITRRHRLFARASSHLAEAPAVIYGRRTLFDYRGGRILVNELFLPQIAAWRA
jgi:chorismate--pyruvate lyase